MSSRYEILTGQKSSTVRAGWIIDAADWRSIQDALEALNRGERSDIAFVCSMCSDHYHVGQAGPVCEHMKGLQRDFEAALVRSGMADHESGSGGYIEVVLEKKRKS